jgi:hypothetical protein
MFRWYLTVFIIVTAFAIGTVGWAADPPPLADKDSAQRLQTLKQDPVHLDAVKDAALAGLAKLFDCPDARYVSSSAPTFIPPLAIDVQGVVTSGLLIDHGTGSGCGKSIAVNIWTVGKDGKNLSVFGMPGTTHADPLLIRDTFHYVTDSARTKIGDCKSVRFVNTEFVGFTGQANPAAKFQRDGGRPWREKWTIDVCRQQTVTVPVDYQPNEKGTIISVQFLILLANSTGGREARKASLMRRYDSSEVAILGERDHCDICRIGVHPRL